MSRKKKQEDVEYSAFVLDWKSPISEMLEELKPILAQYGLHIGDMEDEFGPGAGSDAYHYHFYVAEKPLPRRQIIEYLAMGDPEYIQDLEDIEDKLEERQWDE